MAETTSSKIINGKAISEDILAQLEQQLDTESRRPGLAVLLVGEDPASRSYVASKERVASRLGYKSIVKRLPATIELLDVVAIIQEWNRDPTIDGILVQSPLPPHINEETVTLLIDPRKDVDGFHPQNVGKMVINCRDPSAHISCTPRGILELLERTHPAGLKGQHCVVVGRSNIVGKPIANLMYQKTGGNCVVTICHSASQRNLAEYTRQADILIVAVGRPHLITAEMIKPGATVIDVGINRVEDASRKRGYRLVGDVDFEEAYQVAGHITPVPGGVGPMTIAMLMRNTWNSYMQSSKIL